jgi:hypothetical protein
MTLVGKIFVVAILVMCVVFMGFTMAVYSNHVNWREKVELPRSKATPTKPAGLTFQLDDAKAENAALKAEIERREKDLAAFQAASQQQLGKLESKLDEVTKERDKIREDLVAAQKNNSELTTTVDSSSKVLEQKTGEVSKLRDEIRDEQQSRDTVFAQVVDKTENLHKLHGQLVNLKERNEQLVQEVAHYKRVLDAKGIDAHAPLVDVPPPVDGLITAVRGNDLIEISIGSDDGLKVGHTLEVFREGKAYLGRAEIVKTAPDRAVAKILPDYRKGVPQKGDRVATRLKLS